MEFVLFEITRAIEFVALGALCGFLGGLFGIGGATLAIPVLGIVFGLTEQLAQGTALIMALPNALIALLRYAQKAGLDLRAAALLGLSALPVTYASAMFATSLASRQLRIGFAIFLILIAFDIARRALRKGTPAKTFALPWPLLAVVGAVCGVVSGLFGIGGAIIAVPAMTILFGYSQLKAQGMSLAFAVLSGALTTLAYASQGDVDWGVAIPLAIGGVFAVRYGVDFAHRLPERRLRLAFVAFAIAMGVALLIKAQAQA
jgi:uncharacterized membrane protein YfcA